MKIEFTGRQTEVPPEIRRLAERKLEKLGRLLRGVSHAHVTVSGDRHRQIAEISIRSKHLDLSAQEESSDLGASLSAVVGKLTRQVQRHLGRRRERKRDGRARTRMAGAAEGRGSKRASRVVRTRRGDVRTLTLDEAAIEVGKRHEGFLVFRDSATERVGVLFRRRDGRLGLVEPEA